MSKDAVAAFFRKALEDADLRKELVELAGRHGYSFSVDELDEKELDTVAGGFLKIESTVPLYKPTLSSGILFDKH